MTADHLDPERGARRQIEDVPLAARADVLGDDGPFEPARHVLVVAADADPAGRRAGPAPAIAHGRMPRSSSAHLLVSVRMAAIFRRTGREATCPDARPAGHRQMASWSRTPFQATRPSSRKRAAPHRPRRHVVGTLITRRQDRVDPGVERVEAGLASRRKHGIAILSTAPSPGGGSPKPGSTQDSRRLGEPRRRA